MKLCIKNGIIVNPATELFGEGSLWIEDGMVTAIQLADGTCQGQPFIESPEVKILEAAGKLVVPGLIDLHVHLREPGFEYKEDVQTGSLAAAAGGVTTICAMPNTKPVTDCPEIVEAIDAAARKNCGTNVFVVAAQTIGQKGTELIDVEAMAQVNTICKALLGKGICAISEDGRSVMDASVMLASMKAAKAVGLPVFSHTEDSTLAGTAIGEELIVARDIMLAKETGCRLHLCHISTKGSIEIIRAAKAAGIAVTAETAPHYFWFTEEDAKGNGNRKMNPPLRGQADREAVKAALADGTLEVIATDHAPHHSDEKQVAFEKAMFGVTGLETSFAAAYTGLVKTGILKLPELVKAMSLTPARILGLDRGDIQVGKTADIAIFDGGAEFEVTEESFRSKSKNSPFLGMKFFGKTVCTMVNGKVIWEHDR